MTIDRIDDEDFLVNGGGVFVAAHFCEDISVELEGIGILGVESQCLIHVVQRAFAVAAGKFYHGPQAQKFLTALALHIKTGDLRLRDSKLSLCRVLVMSALVKFHQVHVKLYRVQQALGRSLGQIAESGCVFLNCVLIALFDPRNFAADCVQPIVFGFQVGSALQVSLGSIERPCGQLSLGGGELEIQVFGSSVRSLRVEFGGLLRLAGELIGVGEFGFNIWRRIVNSFQSRDRGGVITRLTIEGSQRPQDLGIVGGALLGHFQITLGFIKLLLTLISEGQQEF